MEGVFTNWYHRVKESYVAVWVFRVFQTSGKMSSAASTCGGSASGGSGALSLMGCVREASPPPQDHHGFGMGEFNMQRNADTLPKEPKKRRFHPLRGLRRIFRRKSRGAADARLSSRNGERDGDLGARDREEVTLENPAGRAEEARSRSASELLTDSCNHQSVFLRRRGVEDSFVKLRGGSGQLSVSHDSVFPGEVPHTRPLSSLDTLATMERRQNKASDETIHKDYVTHGQYNHRISLRVLEQIKTAIENRNQLASTNSESSHASYANGERYQQETTENRFTRSKKQDRIEEEPVRIRITRGSHQDVADKITSEPRGELPELESASLSHTAAHHRISVRPKNRRPPRRSATTNSMSCSTISESSDGPDSLELFSNMSGNSPTESKAPTVLRKSSSRISRNSEIFGEMETKLPMKPASAASLSPDSLDSGLAQTIADHPDPEEIREIKPISRKTSNRISKGSEIFEELELMLPKRKLSNSRLSKSPDSLDNSFSKSIEDFDKITDSTEIRPVPRKVINSISKSTEGFDKLNEHFEPRPVVRKLLLPISKSTDVVSKSSDSLEILETLTSDDSLERRRSSFEIRPRRGRQIMSMSSENFEALKKAPEIQKRSSASDMNLSRGKRHSKILFKSSDSLEIMKTNYKQEEYNRTSIDLEKPSWRSSKRVSSESSDNVELDDKVESRRVRRSPKRIPSSSIIDIFPMENHHEDDKRPTPMRKPPRLQKSSESSELGSTDTSDSERRNNSNNNNNNNNNENNNKSSDSTETLDSLEKDLEHDERDEEISNERNILEKIGKNESWSKPVDSANIDGMEDTNSQEKPYWRQNSETKENMDIHQLLAITIVSRIDNGNNQRNSAVQYPKKKLPSPPTSPVVEQDDNKMLFNNLLANKNDEDLQNMLNGNISEVSTDTKSFKEKLIMFEKLGK